MKIRIDKKEKDFDAVKTMREIRDQFSKEIMNMTFAEEKAYLRKLLATKKLLRLRGKSRALFNYITE